MRSLTARANNSTPTLDEVEAPALGVGDIRIEVRAATVNPVDVFVSSGEAPAAFGLTALAGAATLPTNGLTAVQ